MCLSYILPEARLSGKVRINLGRLGISDGHRNLDTQAIWLVASTRNTPAADGISRAVTEQHNSLATHPQGLQVTSY